MKAIVAHEFGHYVAGDVRLGPWIYKTQSAIARTLETLSNDPAIDLFSDIEPAAVLRTVDIEHLPPA